MKIESPTGLLKQIAGIFPDFQFKPEAYGYSSVNFTYHALFMAFGEFYGARHASLSVQQVKACAAIINDSVERGGDAENAVATCFLEHLNQMKVRKPIDAYLSKAARDRLHA